MGPTATIVGPNDAGKSHILKALDVFFEESKLGAENVHTGAGPSDYVIIKVSFTDLPPTIELKTEIQTSFESENLLDKSEHLTVIKKYKPDNQKLDSISLNINDYENEAYSNLTDMKERDLNNRCDELRLSVPKSGAGITNKSKRDAIRQKAEEDDIGKDEVEVQIDSKGRTWKCISQLFPRFVLFPTDAPLEIGATPFQNYFKPVTLEATADEEILDAKDDFERRIKAGIQTKVSKIHTKLKNYTDAFESLEVVPTFQWEKAVKLDIIGKDRYGVETSLEIRGSGFRRLFMVSYFELKAEEDTEGEKDIIYGIEEPENCLHPDLQRGLVQSFRNLAESGFQIIVTSHSPVFAGSAPIEELVLVTRDGEEANVQHGQNLDLEEVGKKLGVAPSDNLFGFDALCFVEGLSDVKFFQTVASKLKEDGSIEKAFSDVNIGFVITGGGNLKHWMDLDIISNLRRKFCVIVDSDKRSQTDSIPQRKLNWKDKCEDADGNFIILRKREIENYIHPEALARKGIPCSSYDDFTDMKSHVNPEVSKHVEEMTPTEILEMDSYSDNDKENHELKEIIEQVISMVQ